MSRYILFYGVYDYPSGGAFDIQGYSNDLSCLVDKIYRDKEIPQTLNWAHIYDTVNNEIIYEWEDGG